MSEQAERLKRERNDAWEAVNSMIVAGDLQGNGCDKTAERNGIILAANRLAERLDAHDVETANLERAAVERQFISGRCRVLLFQRTLMFTLTTI